jgi:hypothetical protein
MPLAAAAPTLKTAILGAYKALDANITPAIKAQQISLAVWSTLIQAIPQTMVNGNAAPGQVVAAMIAASPSPVTGSGSGGLDKSSPGKGLDAAKSDFVSTMEKAYKDKDLTDDKAAQTLADAIVALYGEAKVMTNVSGMFMPGAAVPAPAGPVVPSPWMGTGTGGIESSSGSGLIPTNLANDLEPIFKDFPKDHKEAATKWADALIKFAKAAIVTTIDQGNAGGGSAVVDPTSGSGSTVAPSSLIASTGTGFVL